MVGDSYETQVTHPQRQQSLHVLKGVSWYRSDLERLPLLDLPTKRPSDCTNLETSLPTCECSSIICLAAATACCRSKYINDAECIVRLHGKGLIP